MKNECQQVNYDDAARVELAMAFANQAAVAIENAYLYEQARQLAALDALAGNIACSNAFIIAFDIDIFLSPNN